MVLGHDEIWWSAVAAIGQVLGAIGKTGNADDPQVIPHLHFEIRYKTHAINPSDQLLDPALTLKKQA